MADAPSDGDVRALTAIRCFRPARAIANEMRALAWELLTGGLDVDGVRRRRSELWAEVERAGDVVRAAVLADLAG